MRLLDDHLVLVTGAGFGLGLGMGGLLQTMPSAS